MDLRSRHNLGFLAGLGVCTIVLSLGGRFLKADAQNKEVTESGSQLFHSAVTDYESGQFEKAEQNLLPLLKRSPQAFDVNELMGLVLAAERRDAEALPYLRNAVRANPGSAAARGALAACLARLGQMAEAEAEFKKAAALKPSDYDSNHNLGEFYVQTGKLTSAIPYLEKAQEIHSSSYDNGYDLALGYLRTQRSREARNLLRNLVRYRDTAELHNLLGEAEEKSGNYLDAAREYEKAARMDPSEVNIFDWGTELLLHHTFEPAIQVFTFGTGKYPGSARMQIGLGLAFYGRASFDKAAAALMRATDLAPRDPRPYLLLGETYSNSRVQVQGVVDRLERLTWIDPTNAQAFYYQALALWKTQQAEHRGKDLSQVESALKKAASLDPKFAGALLQLGNLYSDEDKIPEAISAYEEAIKIDADLVDAHYHLAQLYHRTGKSAEAQKEVALYQRLHQQQLTEREKERNEIQRFVFIMKREDKDQLAADR
jgi:tetratricopeptide (TPR) repeat protein